MMIYLLLSFATAILVLYLLLKTPLIRLALDRPNERSLHTDVVPRTGGVAIILATAVSWLALGEFYSWMAPAFVLLCISFMDDVRGLSVKVRFALQLLVSLWSSCLLFVDSSWWYLLLSVLAITWMMNLYNFMDGSDGLAGGMAVFGFSTYAVAAYMGGNIQLAIALGVIVSASLAFLGFNFHPARIFMGDAGSIPLGFLAGAVGLYGWHTGLWPIWLPMLAFSPFIMDASVTLLRRLLAGEKVWRAHKSHYYQRLIQMGWGHKATATAEYLVMFSCGVSAIVMLSKPAFVVTLVLGFWLLLYLIAALVIDTKWKKAE